MTHNTRVSAKVCFTLTFCKTHASRPKKQLSIHCVLSDIRAEAEVKFEHLAHNKSSCNLRTEIGWLNLAISLLSEYILKKRTEATGCIVANTYCSSLSRNEHVTSIVINKDSLNIVKT